MARLAVHNSKDLPVSLSQRWVTNVYYYSGVLLWAMEPTPACMTITSLTHHLPGPHKF